MNKHTIIVVVIALAAGYVLAPQISKIPVVNRLPQF
jgi:hypothetical protein